MMTESPGHYQVLCDGLAAKLVHAGNGSLVHGESSASSVV